ncbi:hypothetical protein [Paraburkholderia sp. BCC1884]|uniref:hypothetical protein n=1 Tax=Paraburkholderia sp. BCC1884 TaxID=2562668 RepID=UPI001182D770|nr:hypothetical protein [Paraburkholderia sp. BCC1884]
MISWESFNDMATLPAFGEAACATRAPGRSSGADEICPYFVQRRGFMHHMKETAPPLDPMTAIAAER